MLNRAIFLDRDGTINMDSGYTHKIEDWHFLPGVFEALAGFKRAGYKLVVISNQSGIGRGFYDETQVIKLHEWVNEQLRPHGAAIDAWYYCPHAPWEGCSCRKPSPELILRAAMDLNINLKPSYMLGDRLSDAEAGLAAGCKAGLICNARDFELPPGVHRWGCMRSAMMEITGCCGELGRDYRI